MLGLCTLNQSSFKFTFHTSKKFKKWKVSAFFEEQWVLVIFDFDTHSLLKSAHDIWQDQIHPKSEVD